MQPIAGVLETVLYAEDLDAAERFYGEVLGLQLDSRKPGLFCFFRAGPAHAAAVRSRGRLPQSHGAAARCHRRGTRLLRRARGRARRLEAATASRRASTIEHEQTWPRGGRSFYVRDPAGNSIELATPRIWGLPEPTAVPQ